jgi:DNA helicase-2/ATP-dependent DNA helicase PcrA
MKRESILRLPNSKQISPEQEAVYMGAPLDRNILVTGPPGTGKTVIAFLRANTIARRNAKHSDARKVAVLMYNRVLRKYTKNAAEERFDVDTMHRLVSKWWEKLKPKGHDSGQKFWLDCPYKQKESAKTLGAKFHGYKKKWWIGGDLYRENRAAFARWDPRADIPIIGNDSYRYNWETMLDIVSNEVHEGNMASANLDWGSLIIDEAQDFPPSMFGFFYGVQKMYFSNKKNPPVLTVFADENQRLSEQQNSSINEISKNLNITEKYSYTLRKNYRSSKSVAELAETFYCGLPTGKPDLPDRKGPVPVLFCGKKFNESIEYIARYIRNHDNEEIGIIVETNSIRKKIFNALKTKLEDLESVNLQTYASGDRESTDENLIFDVSGTVTVVNCKSCKGLEFDAVFVPELQNWRYTPGDLDVFRMSLYVMVSRAREFVGLMYTNAGGEAPGFLNIMPHKKSALVERFNVN